MAERGGKWDSRRPTRLQRLPCCYNLPISSDQFPFSHDDGGPGQIRIELVGFRQTYDITGLYTLEIRGTTSTRMEREENLEYLEQGTKSLMEGKNCIVAVWL